MGTCPAPGRRGTGASRTGQQGLVDGVTISLEEYIARRAAPAEGAEHALYHLLLDETWQLIEHVTSNESNIRFARRDRERQGPEDLDRYLVEARTVTP